MKNFVVLLFVVSSMCLAQELNDIENEAEIRLKSADEVTLPGPGYMSVAVIMLNVSVVGLVDGILRTFRIMLDSIFLSSVGTPLHLIIITDSMSAPKVNRAIKAATGKYISEAMIRRTTGPRQMDLSMIFPKLAVDFVDLKSITNKFRDKIDEMKPVYSAMNDKEGRKLKEEDNLVLMSNNHKYTQDLYFIAPFYGHAFEKLDKLLAIDADLQVFEDLYQVYKEIDSFERDQVIGIVRDQAGYNYDFIEYMRQMKHPFVKADPMLGLNCGVVIYDLNKMRTSELYNENIALGKFVALRDEFQVQKITQLIASEQDWFTLLLWKYPELFKMLDCAWNVQSNSGDRLPCKSPPKILHKHNEIHHA